MSLDERTLAITVSATAPAWHANQPDLTWLALCKGTGGSAFDGGASLRQGMPSPAPSGGGNTVSITAYSGATVDQKRGDLILVGGGHGDYAGNEVMVLRLRTSQPGWSCEIPPSPGAYTSTALGKNSVGQAAVDVGRRGWPVSSHTYHRLVFANDRVYLCGLSATYPTTQGTSRIFWADRLTSRWCAGAYFITDADAALYGDTWLEEGGCVYVPLDDAIYAEATKPLGYGTEVRVAKISAKTGAVLKRWTTAQLDGFCTGSIYNIPGTRLIVGRSHFAPGKLFVWDTANDPPTRTEITPSGTAAGLSWHDDRFGGAWHIATGGLVLGLGGGESFVKLKPAVPGAYKGAWTATLVQPANLASPSRVVPPADGSLYGRFTIVDEMGDGRSLLVMQPADTSKPVYGMPLPAGGL